MRGLSGPGLDDPELPFRHIAVLLSEQWAGIVVGPGGKGGCVPFGFRYARHSDEPKAEISRVSSLLLSWSHLHGIYSPARHTASLPSRAKAEFAGRDLLA
jgi:hypothetical protein